MTAILAYWKTRGLAQPIRLLLKYVGKDFDDVKYEVHVTDGPKYSTEEWTRVKDTLGLDFPNLPYYIDGDIKITQSNSILRYLGGQNNLLGTTTDEQLHCDMMLDNAMDFRNKTVVLCYNPEYETLKEAYFAGLKDTLASFEKFLSDRPWFAGQSITVCDFPMYELLDQHLIMKPGCLDDLPNLKAFATRFEDQPKLKEYMQSDKFMARPINNKNAGFIGS